MTSQSVDFIDAELLEHARRGLARIHRTIPATREEEDGKVRVVSGSPKKITNGKDPSTCAHQDSRNNREQKIISYISIKAPPKRTVFYEHSKRGLKYWYDDSTKKSFESKSILGRTGTLLGLVDSPYK